MTAVNIGNIDILATRFGIIAAIFWKYIAAILLL